MRRTCLFLCLILLAGCVEQRGIRPLRPQELAISKYSSVIAKGLTGSLAYEEGCLLFRGDDYGLRVLPVWPAGSTFNGTSVTFHEPGKADQRIVLGEQFLMEGQPAAWAALQSDLYAPFHNQCAVEPFFVSKVRPAD